MELSKLFGIFVLIGSGYAATDGSEYDKGESDFLKMTGKELYDPDSMYVIADPTYDQTFKAIFVGEENVGGYTPNQRLISLLNGLLYPEADGDDTAFKIREIESLNSEITSIGLSDSSGVLRFDIACTCYCYSLEKVRKTKPVSKTPKVLDVEMQKSKDSDFDLRLQTYASALKRKYEHEVQIIAFMGHTTKKSRNESIAIVPYIVDDLDGRPKRPLENYTDLRAIDLRFCSDCLQNNQNIFINSKKLGKIGREWLKLLSINQWQKPSKSTNQYFVKTKNVTPEVLSAMTVLAKIDEGKLLEMENALKAEIGALDAAKKEAFAKGIAIGKSRMALELAMISFMEGRKIPPYYLRRVTHITIAELKDIWEKSEKSELSELSKLSGRNFDDFIKKLKEQNSNLIISDEDM